jgi:hypothetical protein
MNSRISTVLALALGAIQAQAKMAYDTDEIDAALDKIHEKHKVEWEAGHTKADAVTCYAGGETEDVDELLDIMVMYGALTPAARAALKGKTAACATCDHEDNTGDPTGSAMDCTSCPDGYYLYPYYGGGCGGMCYDGDSWNLLDASGLRGKTLCYDESGAELCLDQGFNSCFSCGAIYGGFPSPDVPTSGGCDGDCCDSETWYKGNKEYKNCEWVSEAPEGRCATQAMKHCPVSCDTCPSSSPTEAPTDDGCNCNCNCNCYVNVGQDDFQG